VVRNDELVRETDNLLTRAQVAMYPVDARGLQTDLSQNFFNEATNPAIGGMSALAAGLLPAPPPAFFIATSAPAPRQMG
jgi:hypothetical protein